MGTVVLVAGGAALASILGGLVAVLRPPGSLTMSIVFGFASGALIGAVTLEMVPEALALAPLGVVAAGFVLGFALVWLFDLYINRWHSAGAQAVQFERVRAYHRSHRPRGDRLTVLAGGTTVEELIEGLAIGVGIAVDPEVGVLIAAAIALDNLSEGMSIGEFANAARGHSELSPGTPLRRTLTWTVVIALSLFGAACVGYLGLRGVDPDLLGLLLATGAGGMLYLTVSALVPPSEEQQYQGSGALATGLGFLAILLLTGAG
jgi:zinc transporter, ZIP family